MSSYSAIIEQLDLSIGAILAGKPTTVDGDAHLHQLLQVAQDLHYLPRPEFKARLRAELEAVPVSVISAAAEAAPVFAGLCDRSLPLQGMNFVASLALHAAVAAVLFTSGVWVAQQHAPKPKEVVTLVAPDVYALPPAQEAAAGGGGGGDRDVLATPKGALPKTAADQIAPPAVIIRNPDPALAVAPTVVAPALEFPQLSQLGDPLSGVSGPPSNGIGSSGGIGSGSGGGVGTGRGPGVGSGFGGGIGGGPYRVGGGVSAPRAIYSPDPVYSDEARKAKYQGTVVLWLIVGADGKAHEIRVARSLGMGLDEKAIEAVRQWRFRPALKDGKPVAVQINVEVNFRLY